MVNYRNKNTLDSCLHIAARAYNKSLVEYFVNEKIIDVNTVNRQKETALMVVMRNCVGRRA
jgi:ankyrin repeat protein